MIPPITPVMMPANGEAPDATAIPKQRGRATKKTTKPDTASVLTSENIFLFILNNNLLFDNCLVII
jgi:hypothetical protein